MKNLTSIQREILSEPTKLVGASDPNSLLLLYVFNQAIMDIVSYYSGCGTVEARKSGKDAIRWITRFEGTFPMVAKAAVDTIPSLTIEGFHRWCLELIYNTKEACLKKTINRIRIIKKIK